MKKRDVKKVVRRTAPRLVWVLGLNHWHIDITYNKIRDARNSADWRAQGRCTSKVEYKKAYIELDPAEFDSEEQVQKVLLHELLHLFHAELYIYKEQVEAQLGPQVCEAVQPSWRLGIESLVRRIEFMLENGLDQNVDKMIADRSSS